MKGWSQWPSSLQRGSAAARLLKLLVRDPLETQMFVSCKCCVLSGRGLCDELITRPEESYRLWYVVVCDLETSRMRRPWPTLGRSATEKKNMVINATHKSSYYHSNIWWCTFSFTSFAWHATKVCLLIWRILYTMGSLIPKIPFLYGVKIRVVKYKLTFSFFGSNQFTSDKFQTNKSKRPTKSGTSQVYTYR